MSLSSQYLSLRLKVDHEFLEKIILKILHDVPDYCVYKHTSVSQHFHICLPGLGKSDCVRIAKRVRDNFGVSGNGGYSLKTFDNGVASFVFYCGHEGSVPVFANPAWQEIIDSITTYFVKSDKPAKSGQVMLPLGKRTKKDCDLDWQLSYAGLVPKCISYAREHGLTCGLKETARQMFENTRWKPSYQMRTKGVPSSYEDEFEFRSGKRARFEMDWWTPRF